ncbi:MAG TPA: MmgE/PrpD family protein [Steroidobacteraceae bacterium]|nr:MmgE/PrpD family protein [Steroidobacteraceae bacterium]
MARAHCLVTGFAVADYAASAAGDSDDAYAAAFARLLTSFARGFAALRLPACVQMLGPVVPGATMSHGARVPGTSFELDPVTAAFNIGAMVGWLDGGDRAGCVPAGRSSDTLGAVFAVADYLARKAHQQGDRPRIVREMLASMIKAQRIREAIAEKGGAENFAAAVVGVRVASAAVAARLLGGGRAQIAAAAAQALVDGGELPAHPEESAGELGRRCAAADATSRGVRLALRALAAADGDLPAAPSARAALDFPPARGVVAAADLRRAAEMFAASVARHFDPRQAARILSRFADADALYGTPVDEFTALLVRNA